MTAPECAETTTVLTRALCERVAGLFAPPPPPPPPSAPLYERPAVLAFALVLALAGVALWRSPHLRDVVRTAVAAALVQAQPAQVVRWGGPLGRLAVRGLRAAGRFVAHGRRARGRALRAAAVVALVVFVVGSPLGAGGLALSALSAAFGIPTWLLVLAVVAVLVLVAVAGRGEREDTAAWWSERRLVGALVAAGVLPTVREGEGRHVLSRRGQPVHDLHGSAVTFALPGARPWGDVLARRDRIAAALSLDVDRLYITHPAGQPADVVTVQVVSTSRPARTPAVATAERTDWSRPVVLGLDAQGREVLFTTTETHSVLAGATGSGKTALARAVVAHAALDPRVRLFGIDGKGDAGSKGWQALEPRCERFVRGMGPDAPARVEALLTEVSDLARERGDAGHEAPEVLLILEEWATARTVLRRLDAACAERCDALVTVLLATARSRGVHVLLIVQRGTATAFPVDQRANCGQRLVGKFGDSAEAGYVLESLPPRLPSRAGEFAVSLDGKAPSLVTADYLEPAAWTALCARAAALRPGAPAAPASTPQAPAPLPEAPEPVALDPLLAEVLALLADGPPQGMPASALLERLPTWLAPASPALLGKALRAHPEHLQPGYVQGGARVWRAVVTPSSPRRPAVVGAADDGTAGVLHAQTPAAVALPSSPSSAGTR